MTYLLASRAKPETNLVQVEVVFKEVLNMSIKIEALVKHPRFLDSSLVSGPVYVCRKQGVETVQ